MTRQRAQKRHDKTKYTPLKIIKTATVMYGTVYFICNVMFHWKNLSINETETREVNKLTNTFFNIVIDSSYWKQY